MVIFIFHTCSKVIIFFRCYNNNQEIRNNGEYVISYTDINTTLSIENVQLKHAGAYKLVAIVERESICREVTEYAVTLKVAGKHNFSVIVNCVSNSINYQNCSGYAVKYHFFHLLDNHH